MIIERILLECSQLMILIIFKLVFNTKLVSPVPISVKQ